MKVVGEKFLWLSCSSWFQ